VKFIIHNLERFLFLSCIFVFVALIIAQAALLSPAVRTSLSLNSDLEGAPLGTEEILYAEGRLVLQAFDAKKDYNLKVLVNGDEVARFADNKAELTVRNGDVIEIDGSSVHNDVKVAVVYKSDNILTDCLNKAVLVNSNVRRFMKVRIN
jgi:hypothetical protein